MKKHLIPVLLTILFLDTLAQQPATVTESSKVFKTYDFSDPDPVPHSDKIYPYYRFDGYTNTGKPKEWKVVELENDFIKVMILPEIGGKIWTAWDKATGKPFLYYNQVVKFRDVAMRGPWTSGGIEANYGIIGHTPNCATPVDYMTATKPDGSVSCYIGTLDLLTRTYWTIEINLPKDKAWFSTRSFWNNPTPLEQPYYTWMNVGMPSKGNLEFVYPGSHYIGHEGEYADWKINADNGKDISFYENNNFGRSKSYHILGKYSEFFGAYYHDEDFGMARYSLRDEKPGRKIWIWGLSRQGMIWENLLSDTDGQYVEVQSGRLFNQASTGSNKTPFKQLGFPPYTTDEWTEYWFPVKGIKGFVKANTYGALNVRFKDGTATIDFLPLQDLKTTITATDGEKVVYTRDTDLKILQPFSDEFKFSGDEKNLKVTVGGTLMHYSADPEEGVLGRPLESPEDFDWDAAFGQSILAKEYIQQRMYRPAAEHLDKALAKDPYFIPALTDKAMLAYRNMEYDSALAYAKRALSIDTYDPAANFYYGLANAQIGKIHDAKDGFDIASLSPAWRGAAYSELCKLYFREGDLDKAGHYARKSLELNAGNVPAWQAVALIARIKQNKQEAEEALQQLRQLTPLNHFIRFEEYRWKETPETRRAFLENIKNEMRDETIIELADGYLSLDQVKESLSVLSFLPENPIALYHTAFLKNKMKAGDGKELVSRANALSPLLVFPFRSSTAEALKWAADQDNHWKTKYYLALIHWSRDNVDQAQALFRKAGNPEFAPFYAARADLFQNDQYAADVRRSAELDPKQWRYGKMLADHYLEKKKYPEALAVAKDYSQRFPGDFRIDMLLARTLLFNKDYKGAASVLENTTILPYEGATDGRQMYREAWLMQAVDQIQSKRYKNALASIEKAKLWPERLGAGKPYDEDLDLRLEHYLEAVALERSKDRAKAEEKYEAIANAKRSGRNQINNLITALALKKLGRADEGEQLLKEWTEKNTDNKISRWAYAQYAGSEASSDIDTSGNDNLRIVKEVMERGL